MRGQRYKMVYYIGQDQGELYDLEQDPHELWNLWDRPEHRELQNELTARLLRWLAASTYYNAGYRRQRSQTVRDALAAPRRRVFTRGAGESSAPFV